MNKLITVLGVAAVATLTGCKDPHYRPMSTSSWHDVKKVSSTPSSTTHRSDISDIKPIDKPIAPVEPVTCKCPSGTKHTEPCKCGAPDCACVVVKSVEPPKVVVTPPPAEPETTIYIVQRGDYLAKISRKFNIKVDAIKKLNGMQNDVVRVGQKLKLPGKVDVGEQTMPAPMRTVKDAGAKTPAKKVYTPYTGATKEYVVKSGDILGSIALSNGLSVRQLKELNGLKADMIRVGQKLKVPAVGEATPAVPVTTSDAKKVEPTPASVKVATPVSVKPAKPVEPPVPVVTQPIVEEPDIPVVEPAASQLPVDEPPVAANENLPTYTVQEGEDMTRVAIRWSVTASAIRELNNLPDDAQLTPGMVIKLPPEAQQ